MIRYGGLMAWLVTGSITCSAFAQRPVDPSEPLPPGHPPVQAPSPEPLPPGHPPVQTAAPESQAPAALPQGHPPVAAASAAVSSTAAGSSTGLPQGHPPAAPATSTAAAPAHPPQPRQHEPPVDQISPASDLPAGSAEIILRDGEEQPLAGRRVTLVQVKQSVEEGDSTIERLATTDAEGRTRFDGLPTQTSFSYQAVLQDGPARYATDSFRLDEKSGRRATLHVFPVVRDINQALVGMRGVLYVSPREDIFQVEQQFQIFNIGHVTWVPDQLRLTLPAGAKAFSAGDSMSDATVERTSDGSIELRGTYPPGQREVTFRFQLDNPHQARLDLNVDLPPHVAEMRVLTEAGPEVELKVRGFPDAQSVRGKDGKRLLMTGVQMTRGQAPLSAIEINIAGLPVPSKGRWYAVGLALFAVAAGLAQAFRPRQQGSSRLAEAQEDVEHARALLLDELVVLEKIHRTGAVGPRTYEQTRSLLLDALARIDLLRKHAEKTAIA